MPVRLQARSYTHLTAVVVIHIGAPKIRARTLPQRQVLGRPGDLFSIIGNRKLQFPCTKGVHIRYRSFSFFTNSISKIKIHSNTQTGTIIAQYETIFCIYARRHHALQPPLFSLLCIFHRRTICQNASSHSAGSLTRHHTNGKILYFTRFL